MKANTVAEAMTEKVLQANIEQLLTVLGWTYYHTWTAIHSAGGFPDIMAVHPGQKRTIWIELKRENGKLTDKQQYWIQTLLEAGNEVYVIRPSRWLAGECEEILKAKEG